MMKFFAVADAYLVRIAIFHFEIFAVLYRVVDDEQQIGNRLIVLDIQRNKLNQTVVVQLKYSTA